MPTDFQRKILVIDDNVAIHADFQKILAAPAASGADDLGDMAASLFGGAKTAKQRLSYRLATASQGHFQHIRVRVRVGR